MDVDSGYNPLVRRHQLGARLRKLREAAGRSLEDAATHLDCSTAKISRMENARVPVRAPDVRSLLDLYAAGAADRSVVLELVEQSRRTPWWHEYTDAFPAGFPMTFLALEDDAESIRTFEQFVVPGLLQDRAYAHAVYAPFTDLPDAQVDRLVELRMVRQRIITRERPTSLHAVLDEAALHKLIGGPAVMRHQLAHLITAAELPAVTLQVVPFSAGMTAATGFPFTIFSFAEPTMPDVATSERMFDEHYEYRPGEVARYASAFDDAVNAALDPADTIDLISTISHRMRP